MSRTSKRTDSHVFAVKDCALITIATGKKAVGLRELREIISETHLDCIYHHFWGGMLGPRFEEREFSNDFAAWARHGLHDKILSERLAMLDPTRHAGLEELRGELLDLIETRLDESEALHWVIASRPFEFLRSQIVIFDTGRRLSRPEELARLLPDLSVSSLFYHFVDARRRLRAGTNDFSRWLASFGGPCERLGRELDEIEPYFCSLTDLRRQIAGTLATSFGESD